MESERIFRNGYALMIYNPASDERTWKYRDEEITLPAGAVQEFQHKTLKVTLAKIEDVHAKRG